MLSHHPRVVGATIIEREKKGSHTLAKSFASPPPELMAADLGLALTQSGTLCVYPRPLQSLTNERELQETGQTQELSHTTFTSG